MASRTKQNKDSYYSRDKLRGQLLSWYDDNRRDLPWRSDSPDPYAVWLSEIMLQQTTVGAVIPYFQKFMARWPQLEDLAEAPREEVMAHWAGLGYYSRARNLHKCAQLVARDYGGKFPDTEDELLKLPGIGPYTAAAIASIAFNRPAVVVDGNIERITARVFAIEDPLPDAKSLLKRKAEKLYDDSDERPGDLAQAYMDLGAMICVPKNPRCSICPIAGHCKAYQRGIAADLPRRARKTAKPSRKGQVYWIADADGRVLVHRRPDHIMLGGMAALPGTAWHDKTSPENCELDIRILSSDFPKVMHSFTHFDLELQPALARVSAQEPGPGYEWRPVEDIAEIGWPSLYQKAVRIFLTDAKTAKIR